MRAAHASLLQALYVRQTMLCLLTAHCSHVHPQRCGSYADAHMATRCISGSLHPCKQAARYSAPAPPAGGRSTLSFTGISLKAPPPSVLTRAGAAFDRANCFKHHRAGSGGGADSAAGMEEGRAVAEGAENGRSDGGSSSFEDVDAMMGGMARACAPVTGFAL